MQPNVYLKPWNVQDGAKYMPNWFYDDAYQSMWRHCGGKGTLEQLANFPSWADNICFFVCNLDDKIVGMVIGYRADFRNRFIYVGCLIDKRFQGYEYGRNAIVLWIDTLFKRDGLRKILVENIEEYMTKPYEEIGFKVVGRHPKHCLVNGEWKEEIVLEAFNEDFTPIYKAPA